MQERGERQEPTRDRSTPSMAIVDAAVTTSVLTILACSESANGSCCDKANATITAARNGTTTMPIRTAMPRTGRLDQRSSVSGGRMGGIVPESSVRYKWFDESRIDAARLVPDEETPQQAAERLLELVGLLSHHDHLTRGHSERVRAYTQLIGEEMGITGSQLDRLRWAGLLHDIGKTAISTDILNKPGRLTDDEFEAIKTHPEEGRALVGGLADWLGESIRAAWEHHERFDGTGYPRRLSGVDISIAARVVSVADAYDVMTSARSYKKAMKAGAARAELADCAGSQFDPAVVRAFLNVSLGRLRLVTGPLGWLTQIVLFEPSEVAHAAAAQSGSGTVGAGTAVGAGAGIAAAGAGTAAAGAGGVAAIGLPGVASVVVAAALGVSAGTVGIAAADNSSTKT